MPSLLLYDLSGFDFGRKFLSDIINHYNIVKNSFLFFRRTLTV